MITLSERQEEILKFIISFMEENGLPPTIREIGESVNISSTSVVNYNLAKLEDYNLISRRKEISRGLNLNMDQLRNVRWKTSAPVLNEPAQSKNGSGFHEPVINLLRVPVLGSIAAGEPIQVEARDAANPEDWVQMPEGLFNTRGRIFALRVKGDSMIDASVLNGDIVILRHQETADDGEMVAVWIEGDEETTLKYYFREGRNVRLQPANPNPEYKPIIRPADKVRVNGKVVSVLRVLEH